MSCHWPLMDQELLIVRTDVRDAIQIFVPEFWCQLDFGHHHFVILNFKHIHVGQRHPSIVHLEPGSKSL